MMDRKKIKILLWFDVEDYVNPESNDSLYGLLKIMDEEGIHCTAKICGKKIEMLKQYGRNDILELLCDHDIGYHSRNHSVHPMISEYLDRYNFKEGAEEFARRESESFYQVKNVLNREIVTYGQPGKSWAPQVFPVLKKWGIHTYLDTHPILDMEGRPFWYGGVLCMTNMSHTMHLTPKEKEMEALNTEIPKLVHQEEEPVWVSIYNHPTEFATEEMWDVVNYTKGKNPEYVKKSPLRKPEESAEYLNKTKAWIRHMKDSGFAEYVTASEALALEKRTDFSCTEEALREYAAHIDQNVTFGQVGGRYYTAAELFSLFGRYLLGKELKADFSFGPEKQMESYIIDGKVSVKELASAAYSQKEWAMGYRQMCSLYRVGRNLLNPVDLFCTMAEAVRTGAQTVDVCTGGRLSAVDYVDDTYVFGGNWEMWPDDFKGETIIELTKLQTWTLKPAFF